MVMPVEIDQMSLDDKLELLELLWDSIESETANLPLTQAQRAELESRLADVDENPEVGATWEEVRHRIEGQF